MLKLKSMNVNSFFSADFNMRLYLDNTRKRGDYGR